MQQKTLERCVKSLLDIMYYGGCVTCVAVPLLLRWLQNYYIVFQTHYIAMCLLLFVTGAFAVFILGELRKMFQTVLDENCFIQQNVMSLKKMGRYSIMISIATSIRLYYVITPSTVIIIIMFFIAGLFSFVLSRVFQQAIKYKQENDLTI